MATITSLGIASGIDANSIVSSLVALEKAPLTVLQAEATIDNAQITAFAKMQSEFSALADAANAMADPTVWQATKASSSNTNVATITSTATATPGSYTLNVSALAQGQSVSSSSITSGTAVGAGTLTIQLGTWTPATAATSTTAATSASFAANAANPSVAIKVSASDTVATIAASINAANAGVTATTFNDGTGDRLMLSSTGTGAISGFKITAADTSGNAVTDGTGISQLAFDPTQSSDANSGAYGMASSANPVTYAANAQATINGIAVTAATNTLSTNIPGVTINLLATTTTPATSTTAATSNPVTVGVSQDVTSVVGDIQTFVTAYNTLITDIATNTKYDATTQTAALFQGDGSIVGLQSILQTMVGSTTKGSSAYSYLSDVGLSVQTDGTLAIDTTKLGAAANNGTQLQALFTTNNNNVGTNGFALKFGNFCSGAIAAGGLVYTKNAALQTVLTQNTTDQASINDKASALQTRLQAQYSALDTQMASINALASYVSQQVTTWNKSTTTG